MGWNGTVTGPSANNGYNNILAKLGWPIKNGELSSQLAGQQWVKSLKGLYQSNNFCSLFSRVISKRSKTEPPGSWGIHKQLWTETNNSLLQQCSTSGTRIGHTFNIYCMA
jgi:hypothetical protein